MDVYSHMSVPSSTGASSTSLRLGGTETLLPQPLSPRPHHRTLAPSPGGRQAFEKKPLPPIPYKRESMASILSKEMTERFKTPKRSPDFMSRQSLPSPAELDNGEAEIKVILDNQTVSKTIPERPRVETANISRASPPNQALSPPPQPQSAEPKLQRLTGVAHIPTLRGTAPSGHNSDEKLYAHLGFGLNPAVVQQKKQVLQEQHSRFDDSKEVLDTSPLSLYGQADLKSALSGLDADVEGNTGEISSGSSSSYFGIHPSKQFEHSSAVPEPLGIVKPPKPPRSPEPEISESWDGSIDDDVKLRFHDYLNARTKRRIDEYHETLANNAVKHGRKEEELPQSGDMSSDSFREFWAKQLASAHQNQSHLHHPIYVQVLSPSVSTERLRQVWRPSVRESSRVDSVNTFGRLTNPFRTQHSAPASPSLDPGLRTKWEYDSDRATLGTPKTGRSIPISSASSSGDSPNTSPSTNRTSLSPTSTRHRRNSLVAKFFHRDRASTSPITPEYQQRPATADGHPSPYPSSSFHPTPPRPPPPSLIPTRTPPAPALSSTTPGPNTQPQPSGPVPVPVLPTHHPSSTTTPPELKPKSRPKASSISSTLTTLTSILKTKSPASLSAMRMSGEERWRQKMKESIVLMPGGGQVHALGPRSGGSRVDGGGAGVGSETRGGGRGLVMSATGTVRSVGVGSGYSGRGKGTGRSESEVGNESEKGGVGKGTGDDESGHGKEKKGYGSSARSSPAISASSSPAPGLSPVSGIQSRRESPKLTPSSKESPRPSGERGRDSKKAKPGQKLKLGLGAGMHMM